MEERQGEFYLGKYIDGSGELGEHVRYDAKDLTTHGVCVGMTGSGKTGLCISLLEEAALDGVPALCIDPKGDLGNLLLTFPELAPSDFQPWIDPADAERKGKSVEEQAAATSELWRSGLAKWDQSGERIRALRDRVDLAIYTPGSSAGMPLSVLKGLNAPPEGSDDEALRERVLATVSGILALVGIEADPVQSREHVFLSNIVHRAWAEGSDLAIGELIRRILEPPFSQIGVLDVESFFPSKDRQGLAMKLNALLASPSFAGWLEGEALDVQKLLYTDEGKPRICVLSIAHLSDAERMFFVTLLLGEVVAWMRAQAGTSSLRALIYMDEVVGFLPPVAEPPSKKPLMTLLKQARAFGVGCLLATQNPVDVDYKALSNCGTWFLGRLQTERDVDRVIDGLMGAAQVAGQSFDPKSARATLAGLESRVFLMNNVHDAGPRLFRTRWALSYLRGPLTRQQIGTLMAERKAALASKTTEVRDPESEETKVETTADAADTIVDGGAVEGARDTLVDQLARPVVPEHIEELFWPGAATHYEPALFAWTNLHYSRARAELDHWYHPLVAAPLVDVAPSEVWKGLRSLDASTALVEGPSEGATFGELPRGALTKARVRTLTSALKSHCYTQQPLIIGQCKALKLWSRIDESREEFGARVAQAVEADLVERLEKVYEKHAKRIEKVEAKLDKAKQKVGVEEGQLERQKLDSNLSMGTAVLSAVFGRGSISGHARRAASSAKRVQKVKKEERDVARARAAVEKLEDELAEAQNAGNAALDEERAKPAPTIDEVRIAPRKSDIEVERLSLVWVPSGFFA